MESCVCVYKPDESGEHYFLPCSRMMYLISEDVNHVIIWASISIKLLTMYLNMIVEKLRGGGLVYDEVKVSSLLWLLRKLQPLTRWKFFLV